MNDITASNVMTNNAITNSKKSNLTRYERETIISFNEEEKIATCYTFNGKLLRQLSELATTRPEECKLIRENNLGGITYQIPKKWVKVRASRILSEEQRKAMSDRMKKTHENNSRSKINSEPENCDNIGEF